MILCPPPTRKALSPWPLLGVLRSGAGPAIGASHRGRLHFGRVSAQSLTASLETEDHRLKRTPVRRSRGRHSTTDQPVRGLGAGLGPSTMRACMWSRSRRSSWRACAHRAGHPAPALATAVRTRPSQSVCARKLPLRAIGGYHVQEGLICPAEDAGEAAAVEGDGPEYSAALGDAYAALVRHVGVRSGTVGVEADAVGSVLVEIGPNPTALQSAVRGDAPHRTAPSQVTRATNFGWTRPSGGPAAKSKNLRRERRRFPAHR
jgi:hypothetical protein